MRLNFTRLAAIFIWLFLACEENEERICTPYEPPTGLDIYKFKLIPGMPEWAELESGDDKYAVTQLPDSILQAITTAGLVETCYNYPLRINMIAWTRLQDGVAAIVDIFNGFQELSQRDDAAAMLLKRYEVMDPAALKVSK